MNNATKEVDKNNSKDHKKTSDDNSSSERHDNKRRDSVTGSVLDTGSSSNSSSADSDELELLDSSCESKKIMATTLTEEQSAISESSNRETTDERNAILHEYGEDLSSKTASNAEENFLGGKQTKFMNGPSAMTNDESAASKAHRRATKKQVRRERRQKEKEKHNGENQYQQAQEKATRDRLEKASVVQNLLSLRITDNQSVAQKRSHQQQQQQQQQQQSVPISFGDFNEENRVCPSQSQSTGNNNTFTTFSGMNTFNENELIQVYSTGNKLHGLFRCDDSSTNAPSKVQLPLDNTSSHNHMDNGNAGEDNSDSLTNKDGLEMENVLKMVDDSNKLAQKYSQWMRSFHNSLVDGEPEIFMNKFNCILRILKKSAARIHYEKMTERQFTEHVMSGVIHQFYNEKQHTTVLHQLAATRNINKPCSVRDHGSCRMIRLILDMLSWKDMRSTMRERTTRTGKTAMHLAASTGQSCQLDALMSYDMCPNILDRSGRAPIHYAVANNNVHLVKMLLWYGADLSLMERQCTPLQLASLNPCTLEVANFLDMRRSALEKIFIGWAGAFVRGVWTPYRAISDLHFMRLSREGDSRADAIRTDETRARSTTLNVRINVAQNADLKKCPLSLLFIIPTFYKNDDRYADATDPQIFRASITSDVTGDICELIQDQPKLESKTSEPLDLKPAFKKPHNGHFYVYELPRKLPQDVYTLKLIVNTEQMKTKAPHINLAVQAIACTAPEQRCWEAIRIGNTKTKLD